MSVIARIYGYFVDFEQFWKAKNKAILFVPCTAYSVWSPKDSDNKFAKTKPIGNNLTLQSRRKERLKERNGPQQLIH